ncbi:MAG: UvrD-helicase domain-containing protein [Bdellovibrionales bacterium]|nr:UvrD-helicase domain-containing protein [Bdellovibrionales bacterium]
MSTPPKITPIDQSARLEAIESPIEAISVVAGAGCGKTTLLTDRYVDLLISDQRSPREIVAITFTEKSALELKQRIRQKLLAHDMHEALQEIEYAPIGTIHSFCFSLLREHPFEAELDPAVGQFDDVELSLFLHKHFRSWFAQYAPSVQESFYRWFSHGLNFEHIRQLALGLYLHRQFHLPDIAFQNIDLDSFLFELREEALHYWKLAQDTCAVTSDEGYQNIEKLYQQLQNLEHLSQVEKEKLILSQLSFSSKGAQKNWLDKEACKAQKKFFASKKIQASELSSHIRRRSLKEVLDFVSSFPSFLQVQKMKEAKIDFDDLLIKSYEMLKHHPSVRAHYQSVFSHFLIDEFQDTDPLQMKIFSLLLGGNEQQMFSHEQKQRLFIVGDQNQSIYRFRQASVEIYQKVRKQIQEKGQELSIHQNFRSTEKILSWVNDSFDHVFDGQYLRLAGNPYHLEEKTRQGVHLLQAPDDAQAGAQDMRLLEAASIAHHIQKLVLEKNQNIYDPSSHTLRKVEYGDIAILFPTTRGLDFFEQALRQRGIPFSVDGGSLFFQRMEIQAMIASLAAILDPGDSISFVAAIRSVFFGLTLSQVQSIASACPGFDYTKHEKIHSLDKDCKNIVLLFDELFSLSSKKKASEIIEIFYEKTFALSLAHERFHGAQSAANLRKFLWMAQSFESQTQSLTEFYRWIEARQIQGDKLSEAKVSEMGQHEVKLMTIHKSKGLEFPIVFLSNLGAGELRQNPPFIKNIESMKLEVGLGSKEERFSSIHYEQALEKEKLALQEEKKRLLYVGATRAKDLLILCKFLPLRNQDSLFSLIKPALEKVQSQMRLVEYDVEEVLTAKQAQEKTSLSLDVEHTKTYESFKSKIQDRRKNWTYGYRKKRPSEKASLDQQSFFPERSKEGTHIGVLMHEILDMIVSRRQSSIEKWMIQKIQNSSLSPHRDEMLHMLEVFFDSPMAQRIQNATQLYTEMPFSFFEKGVLYEGSMDLVFLEDNQWVLVDYKSDQIRGPQDLAQKKILYTSQLEIYRRAIEKNPHAKVKEALLLFLRTGDEIRI